MARDHARIHLSMWTDDDFLDLTPAAQHLYFLFLTSPHLSYAGVGDWRPARILPMASGWTRDDLERAAQELAHRLFIVVDEDTEEVLVRSFIRHDGLMKQPRMAVAMSRAYAAIASRSIRQVVVHELQRLHEDEPDMKGWGADALDILKKRSVNPSVYPTGYGSVSPSTDGSVWGSVKGKPTPKPEGSVKGCPTPAPTPAPYSNSLSPAPAESGASDERSGPKVPIQGWKLVREHTPANLGQSSRSMLAIRVDEMIRSGTPESDVRACLDLWMTKPEAGPGLLPHLLAEVVKTRDHKPVVEGAATRGANE